MSIRHRIEWEFSSSLASTLEHALKDFRECVDDDDYVIDMGTWHKPKNDGFCYVCLAGSVLAKTYNKKNSREALPSDACFGREKYLLALDYLRSGYVTNALNSIHDGDIPLDKVRKSAEIESELGAFPQPEIDMDGFLEKMHQLHGMLEKHDL